MRGAVRGSKYDLGMSWNYVRLALQSAHQDQKEAAQKVAECTALLDVNQPQETWRRDSIRCMALALATLMATAPAEAKCRHFTIWNYPWAQSCSATGKARAVNHAPQETARADRSWYVEMMPSDVSDGSKPPPKPTPSVDIDIKRLPENVQREIGIEALRQILNNLRLDP